ncbi:hypothetical protein P3T76_011796 [Phytophthora citrophthora]|uniref:Crinkler (CRN) family protein n=1 Tax=Phytophthora citrophthora TaxID=4793 RepID=A0AAD9G846_9STRA|nr:hypothetical protein P3T76_011796 [Phytophthora citrophthora]
MEVGGEGANVFFLEDHDMFFVNRGLATDQLTSINKKKFNRALKGRGTDWEIPLIDNVFGLGKSTFGDNYIRKCREIWQAKVDANPEKLTNPEGFMPVLCQCHTIHITLEPGSLSPDNLHDRYEMDKKIVRLICRYFDHKLQARPEALSEGSVGKMQSSGEVLEILTAEVGPLFIVLDVIGRGFEDENIDKFGQRELFMRFCRVVLMKWLPIPKVFFLLAGRASFLSYVGLRPGPGLEAIQASPFKFFRLSLHRLRWDAIADIITYTLVDEIEKKTIQQHFDLNAEQVAEVAHNLFDVTLGHPRSLLAAFQKCRSYDDLVHYDEIDMPDFIDWVEFSKRIASYAEPLGTMMSRAIDSVTVNMADTWEDVGGEKVFYDTIANGVGIAWEGTLDKATLYLPPFIQQMILAFLYPLRKYLLKVAKSKVSLDYPAVFEWVCLKRFQELFDKNMKSHGCPKDTLPVFFY